MLQPIMHKLAASRIVLASGSPRRKDILSNIGLKFEVIPSTFEEDLDKSCFPNATDYVKETARIKTLSVAKELMKDKPAPDLIIGADTVLTMDGKIFEKPNNDEEAFKMLSGFSGRDHVVTTGVVFMTPKSGTSTGDGDVDVSSEFNVVQFHEETTVHFAELKPHTIRAYIKTGEPRDKAGGYGIQALGGTLIRGVDGDYFNVMGFPLHKFSLEVLKMFPDTDS